MGAHRQVAAKALFLAYLALTWAARRLLPAVLLWEDRYPKLGRLHKLAEWISGRRYADERLISWGVERWHGSSCDRGGAERDAAPSAPARRRTRSGRAVRRTSSGLAPGAALAWFHAPSVGELQQAQAVFNELRELRPGLEVILTHFSPSATRFARRVGATCSDRLPWDLPSVIGPVLDAFAPDLMVFTRTEIWPALARELERRSVPTALIGGTLAPGAGRSGRIARTLLGPAWRALSLCCAVDEASAERFARLGVRAEAITVTGDPAVAAAEERVLSEPDLPPLPPRPLLVAGSTWPADERLLARVLAEARRSLPELMLVITPHEASFRRVREIRWRLRRRGVRAAALSDARLRPSMLSELDAMVIDEHGVLAPLYRIAAESGAVACAYVGGGLGRKGLHSVIEPAAAGCPVFFGPRHERAPAAAWLLGHGGGSVVRSAAELAAAVTETLGSNYALARAAAAGRRLVSEQRDAARLSAELLSARLRP